MISHEFIDPPDVAIDSERDIARRLALLLIANYCMTYG
jgi:hypothetical protein